MKPLIDSSFIRHKCREHERKVVLQEKENAGRKEELERQDRQALLDLFIELARRDEESRKKRFSTPHPKIFLILQQNLMFSGLLCASEARNYW